MKTGVLGWWLFGASPLPQPHQWPVMIPTYRRGGTSERTKTRWRPLGDKGTARIHTRVWRSQRLPQGACPPPGLQEELGRPRVREADALGEHLFRDARASGEKSLRPGALRVTKGLRACAPHPAQ